MTQLTPQDTPDLESAISTAELRRRPSRAPDYAAENRADASKLVSYATQPDGSLREVSSTKIPYTSPQGLAGF